MNDDLQGQIDAQFDVLNQTENEEEKMRRMAEEAAAAKASAPVVEQQAAIEAPVTAEAQAPQEAPQEAEAPQEGGGIGDMLMGVSNAIEDATGINLTQTAMDLVAPTVGMARKTAEAATNVLGEDNPLSQVTEMAADGSRMIQGAGAGIVESVGSGLEILGDVAKSIPGLVNQEWKPDAKDDVFQYGPDSKYEWAKWDMGKDEIGAQTATGKVTQGFLEMGALMAATGGFASAAKGAGIVKSGLVGARSGIIADMISATKGDGNLSTLIRDNAPDWYPHWLTALAVTEEDSPLTAIAKTAAEGSVLGFAADAMGAFLAGSRAANRARLEGADEVAQGKAAEKAFQDEQLKVERAANGGRTAKEAVEAMAKFMQNDTPTHDVSAYTGYRKLLEEGADYVSKTKDPILQENFMRLYEQAANGVPVSIDDVKLLFPEKFTPGTRVIQEPRIVGLDEAIESLPQTGGFTIDPTTGLAPKAENLEQIAIPSQPRLEWNQLDEAGRMQASRDIDVGTGEPVRVTYDQTADGSVEINWDADGLGGQGVKVLGEVSDDISSMKPGTVVKNMPTADDLGGSGRSGAQLRKSNNATLDIETSAAKYYAELTGQPLDDANELVRSWTFEELSEYVVTHPEISRRAMQDMQAVGNEGGIRARLYKRVGFGDVHGDGYQYGVVRQSRDGRKVLEPVEPTDDIQDIINSQLTGQEVTAGTMVAIDGVSLEKLDEDSIAAFMSQYYDLLTRDDVFIGGWISERTGKPVLELSRKVADGDEAMMFGKLFDQEGVFRNSDFEYIPTGGKDELKLTEGMHVRSQTARAPMDPAPTNKVDAAASAVAETGYGVPNTAQRVMTDAKFKMIAEGTDDYTQRILRGMLEDGSVPLNNISKVVGKSTEQLAKEAREFIQMVTGGSGTVDFSKIKGAARDQYGNEILGDAQLVAVIQMMKDTSQAISASVKGLTTKFEAGMDIADDLVRLTNQQKALMKIHKETTAFQGRSLYNNRIDLADVDIDNPLPPVDVQKLQRQYDKATKKLDDMVEAAVSGDPAAKQEAYRMALQLNLAGGRPEDLVSIQKSIGSGITEQLLGNMYNSLLSGPETHLVNSLSSLVMTVYRPLSLAIGSGFKKNAEAFAAFHGVNQTLSDAWRLTTDAYKNARSGQVANRKTGQRLTSGLEQLRTHQAYAEASDNPFVKAAVGFESMLYDLRQNPLLAWSGPLMEAEDTFASAISARFEFNSNMMRRAIEEANGDNVDDVFRALLDQEKKRYFTESGEILDPRLQEVADESTFRHKLEGKAAEFADLVAKVPILRPFFPFVKTGHNIMVFTAESTPLTVFTKEWQDVMAGSDESAKAILRGRAATGSFIMVSAALMAGQGLITGNGPAPGPAREAWERNHKPRSIKIGDQWVSYERMEPFSSVIQAAADVTWGIKEGLISENKAEYLTSYMAYAFAANFTDKSVFSGLEPLSRILNPTMNSAETVAMVPAEVINNVIPLASVRRALANAMQPHRDYYDSQWQRLLDQATGGILPGIGHTQYDWLDGSPITSGNQGLYNAISPINVHKRGTDIVRDTLETLGYDSQTILKTTSGEELTAQERSELSKLMGGGALYKELESAIKVRGYDKFGEELRKARGRDLDVTGVFEKGGNLGTDAQQSAYVEINEIVMKHRDMALEAIRTRNSRLDTAAGKKQKRKDEARTRTAEDLRNFHKN